MAECAKILSQVRTLCKGHVTVFYGLADFLREKHFLYHQMVSTGVALLARLR
jgi:hypothetical protein